MNLIRYFAFSNSSSEFIFCLSKRIGTFWLIFWLSSWYRVAALLGLLKILTLLVRFSFCSTIFQNTPPCLSFLYFLLVFFVPHDTLSVWWEKSRKSWLFLEYQPHSTFDMKQNKNIYFFLKKKNWVDTIYDLKKGFAFNKIHKLTAHKWPCFKSCNFEYLFAKKCF